MNKKWVSLMAGCALLTVLASVGISHLTTATQEKPKEIVTVDLQKLIRIKSEQISKRDAESGVTPSKSAQMEMAAYTEQLNERMAHVAENAGVIIFLDKAVIAGAARDITDLFMDK